MEDLRLLEKIYFKNELTYPNKINKTFLLYISFKMKKLISFSLKDDALYMLRQQNL